VFNVVLVREARREIAPLMIEIRNDLIRTTQAQSARPPTWHPSSGRRSSRSDERFAELSFSPS